MSEDDTELVNRARSGDRLAFEELVRRTSRLVYARLYLETGNVHRAEDLLQETYLQAFRSMKHLSHSSAFRTWLLRIARSVVVDAARRDTRLKRTPLAESDTPVEEIPGSEPPPEAEMRREELRQRVLTVLRSLPETYRLPLTLRYIVGEDAGAIGEQLGMTNGSLRGLLHRGLKMFRDRLPPGFEAELDG
jgi:RNA polymerase sigma-70 factor (ECF subfamily)